MNQNDLVYRRDHPLLKAGKKSPSLLRTIFDPMEPMDLFDDDNEIRIFVYPVEETMREDLEILGHDLWTGFVQFAQGMESREKTQ